MELSRDSTVDRHAQRLSPTITPSTIESVLPVTAIQERCNGSNLLGNDATALSMQETEALFDRYQRLMAPYMPFVVIPTGITASCLAKTKPLLLQAITTVASFHNTALQQIVVKNLMRQISERMLIDCEKSLDLLQFFLVIMTWHNPHLSTPSNHTVVWHLAMSLIHDLDIDRAPGFCEKASLSCTNCM
jgi:hypothetical protein